MFENPSISVNVAFWTAWFKWVTDSILAIAKKGDFLGLATFCGELGQILQLLIITLESLAECFSGSWFSIFTRVLAWAKANPDPFKPFRTAAEAFQQKWTKILAGG